MVQNYEDSLMSPEVLKWTIPDGDLDYSIQDNFFVCQQFFSYVGKFPVSNQY